uniref:(northern house mosquito) hypothetical protein n=1 Tax=Culex pipiens TaxID=7175 RepID=A0A8D8BDT3_CULPI
MLELHNYDLPERAQNAGQFAERDIVHDVGVARTGGDHHAGAGLLRADVPVHFVRGAAQDSDANGGPLQQHGPLPVDPAAVEALPAGHLDARPSFARNIGSKQHDSRLQGNARSGGDSAGVQSSTGSAPQVGAPNYGDLLRVPPESDASGDGGQGASDGRMLAQDIRNAGVLRQYSKVGTIHAVQEGLEQGHLLAEDHPAGAVRAAETLGEQANFVLRHDRVCSFASGVHQLFSFEGKGQRD